MSADEGTGTGSSETPDYAGKSGGHTGGPGGHARDRLEELIAQRVPEDEESPPDDEAGAPDDETAGPGTGPQPDDDTGPSGAGEAREEGHDDEGRTG